MRLKTSFLMKVSYSILLALAVGMPIASAFAETSQTITKIRETGIITIGYSNGSAPFSYIDRKPVPIGYSIDVCHRIVDAIKAKLQLPDLQIKYTPVTTANRISFVANDIVDLECGTSTNNAERQKRVAFTVTTFVATGSMAVKRRSGIRNAGDLGGETVVSTAGSTSMNALVGLNRSLGLRMNIVAARDHVAAFSMLEAGRASAFVMDDVLLHGFVANSKKPSDYDIRGFGTAVEPYGILLRKGDAGLKRIADDTIIRMFTSGEMTALYEKWFQSPIPPKYVSLSLPMKPAFRRLISRPTDSGDPDEYR